MLKFHVETMFGDQEEGLLQACTVYLVQEIIMKRGTSFEWANLKQTGLYKQP